MDSATSAATSALDEVAIERRNMTRLLRWVSMFIAWPSLTIAFAFLVFTGPTDHWLHIAGLMPLGIAALVLFAMAPRLAEKWVQDG
jgi:hypothetical protein